MSHANQPIDEQAAAQEELPKDLVELAIMIAKLPNEHREVLEPAVNKVIENSRRRRRIYTLVQEALSQLRLDMKYLMFDLEATRRERDHYKAESGGNGDEE
ncbi:transcriptional regulator [Blastopirellula marina]|uniref:Transcriptional regulator n=1 Tax=Blastopirellula marina TaxID=124 RepID=A0A2S8FHR9_9BACT|nr:transcriptional regulator [Blastopirellula marina]PQO31718.1 transcriptional regulator [Blastopirellula marina]PTL43025.1 transcriptional regulator [Blastopirellula marina]